MKRPGALERSREKHGEHAARHPARRSLRSIAVPSARKSPELQWRLSGLELDFSTLKLENERLLSEVADVRHSREHFERIFEQVPAPLAVINDVGGIVHLNASARQLLQVDRSTRLPNFFGQFIVRGGLATFLRLLRECKVTGHAVSGMVDIKRPSREMCAVLLSVAPFIEKRGARISRFCVALADQNDRLSMERRVREWERAYQDFLNSMDAVLWEADAQTLRRTYVSKHVERLLGYPRAQWLGEQDFWQKHIQVDDREQVIALALTAIAARQNFSCEYRIYTADRKLLWVRDRVTILEQDGKLKLRGITLDISETKEAQQKLQEAHEKLEERVRDRTAELQGALKELEAFSYTLSHDLRAPLRSMHGYAELVEELSGEKMTPDAREYLRRIRNSAFRLDALIQDVLKYSKISQGPLELRPVQVEKLVRELMSEYPVFQSGQAEVQIDSPLAPVMGHEGFLTQCVSNLLSNAVKFVPKGTKPRVRVYTRRRAEQVQVCFEDNGIGIEPKDQRRIFRIFQRLNPPKAYEGTGIGLAIVQRAAERMGGHAGVDSTPGRGSTFWLQLQQAKEE